jgi:hypothetical protein
MPYMAWSSLLNSPGIGAGAAYANSVTITDVSAAPQFTLPANFLQVGSALRFEAFGVLSTTGTPTMNLGFYYGGVAGTALAATGAITQGSAVTNVPWRIGLTAHVRTVGSSGTVMCHGSGYFGSAVSTLSAEVPLPATALATVTIDTTAAKVLSVGATWGTQSASNTLTLHGFTIESLGV